MPYDNCIVNDENKNCGCRNKKGKCLTNVNCEHKKKYDKKDKR